MFISYSSIKIKTVQNYTKTEAVKRKRALTNSHYINTNETLMRANTVSQRGYVQSVLKRVPSWRTGFNIKLKMESEYCSLIFNFMLGFLLPFYCILLIISSNGIGISTVKPLKESRKQNEIASFTQHIYPGGTILCMIMDKQQRKKKQRSLVLTGSVIFISLSTLQPSTLHPIILQTIQKRWCKVLEKALSMWQ